MGVAQAGRGQRRGGDMRRSNQTVGEWEGRRPSYLVKSLATSASGHLRAKENGLGGVTRCIRDGMPCRNNGNISRAHSRLRIPALMNRSVNGWLHCFHFPCMRPLPAAMVPIPSAACLAELTACALCAAQVVKVISLFVSAVSGDDLHII